MKDNPINSVDSWIGYCTRLFFNIQALSIIYRVFLDTQVSLAPAHFNYTVHTMWGSFHLVLVEEEEKITLTNLHGQISYVTNQTLIQSGHVFAGQELADCQV